MEERGEKASLTERLLREVLATPALKELIILQLKEIRPENARGLARTILWGDPGLSLSLVGSLPEAVNWVLEFLLELGRQLESIPEPLLQELVSTAISRVDTERLRLLGKTFLYLGRKALSDRATNPESRARFLASLLNRAASSLDRLASSLESEATSTFLKVFREETDWKRLAGSSRRLLRAFLSAARKRPAAPMREEGREQQKALIILIFIVICLVMVQKVFRPRRKRSNQRED